MAKKNIRRTIRDLVCEKGPVGWRSIEIRLTVARREFKEGYTLMTYLDEMERDGELFRLEDGKYSAYAPEQ